MASRCTLVTSGQVASITRSPRRRASWRTAGETPCALKMTVASSGTSSSSSTKWAPLARSASTTCRLCTISRRTYTGGGLTWRASSTMSMARSTPAQKPRGPASTISWRGWWSYALSLLEVPGQSHDTAIRVEAAVLLVQVPVGYVLEAVPDVDGQSWRDEVREPDTGFEHEGEGRVDLHHLEAGARRPRRSLEVRHERSDGKAQQVIAERQLEPLGGGRFGREIVLEPALESRLECPAKDARAERLEEEIRQPRVEVDERDVRDGAVTLVVVLDTAAEGHPEGLGALGKLLLGVEGGRIHGRRGHREHEQDQTQLGASRH